MPRRLPDGRDSVGTSRVRSTYTQNVASFANRLVCLGMALALSGSPAVMATCLALCLASPASATGHAGPGSTHHDAHDGAAEPAAVSPHAHHSAESSSAVNGAAALAAEARLVGRCDGCCGGGLVEMAAGPGVERTDAKALAAAPCVEVASRHISVANRAVAPPSPPVPPASPIRSPLVLRI